MRNKVERKTHLTPAEKITAAYQYWIEGKPQHLIAANFSVNQGRVSETIAAIRTAIPGLP